MGHAALLSANVMWGLMAPLGKDLLNSGTIPSMPLAAIRIIAAALLFWIVSLAAPKHIIRKEKTSKSMFVTGVNKLVFCQLNNTSYIFWDIVISINQCFRIYR